MPPPNWDPFLIYFVQLFSDYASVLVRIPYERIVKTAVASRQLQWLIDGESPLVPEVLWLSGDTITIW